MAKFAKIISGRPLLTPLAGRNSHVADARDRVRSRLCLAIRQSNRVFRHWCTVTVVPRDKASLKIIRERDTSGGSSTYRSPMIFARKKGVEKLERIYVLLLPGNMNYDILVRESQSGTQKGIL